MLTMRGYYNKSSDVTEALSLVWIVSGYTNTTLVSTSGMKTKKNNCVAWINGN